MSDQDPIFRALAKGDKAMPDGDALSRLGSLLREGASTPQPVDLRSRIHAALQEEDEQLETSGHQEQREVEDAAIDAWYNGDRAAAVASDPLLERLGELIRESAKPPRSPDLLPRVSAQVQRQKSSRRQTVVLDRVSRWRIWTAVVAGHAAAFIALAAIHVSVGRDSQQISPEMAESMLSQQPGYHRIVPSRMIPDGGIDSIDEWTLPQKWADLSPKPGYLFALRENTERKRQSRQDFAALSGAPAVHAMDAWLIGHVDDQGSVIGLDGLDRNASFVARAAVLYALMGEGVDEPHRRQLVTNALASLTTDFLDQGASLDARTHCLSLLTVVEGASLLADDDLKAQAAVLLQRYGYHLSQGVEEGGLGGFGLLAVEIAALNNIPLPAGLRASVQRNVARPLPSDMADPARLGVAAYARQINGAGHALSTAQQLNTLMTHLPSPAEDGRLDLMAWYFPTLALREARDRRWVAWNQALEVTLQRSLHPVKTGGAYIAGDAMRYGGQFSGAGDLTATAFAMMALQAPYRYLPMGF